ncbi:MAG: YegP family protein [Candidatus Bathyarchaeota archaeon]|nr:MAG: YegP family protein [Candidatus Bathyarchaeota archaeon]
MSAMPKYEIYKDAAGKFRWRLKAPNGEIIASSEAYESKDSCKSGIESVKTNAPKAEIADTTV